MIKLNKRRNCQSNMRILRLVESESVINWRRRGDYHHIYH